jgi:hypothetical protein
MVAMIPPTVAAVLELLCCGSEVAVGAAVYVLALVI